MAIDSQATTPSYSQNKNLSSDAPNGTIYGNARTSTTCTTPPRSSSKIGGGSNNPNVGVKLVAKGMHENFSPFGISDIECDLESIDLVCGYENFGNPRESVGDPNFGLLGLDGNALTDTSGNLRDFDSSEMYHESSHGVPVISLSS
ncbi:unnamed protein product [Linum trigynum]|uniref:Uncharacterized protein n=1 Tax=Linum trigynum TaxID=586398 RepID=A0AAV2CGG1_9ROSI